MLNEYLAEKTPLKLTKFRIGEIRLNFELGLNSKVSLSIDKVRGVRSYVVFV